MTAMKETSGVAPKDDVCRPGVSGQCALQGCFTAAGEQDPSVRGVPCAQPALKLQWERLACHQSSVHFMPGGVTPAKVCFWWSWKEGHAEGAASGFFTPPRARGRSSGKFCFRQAVPPSEAEVALKGTFTCS